MNAFHFAHKLTDSTVKRHNVGSNCREYQGSLIAKHCKDDIGNS